MVSKEKKRDETTYKVQSFPNDDCSGSADWWMTFTPNSEDCLDVVSTGGTNPPTFQSLKAISCNGNVVGMEQRGNAGCTGTIMDTIARNKSFFKDLACDAKQKLDIALEE